IDVARRGRAFRFGDRTLGEALPEAAPLAEGERERLHARTPFARRLRPARKAARDQALELGADRLPEHGRRTIRRDADDERRTIDDRAEREVAERRLVDDVDRHARGARLCGEYRSRAVVLEGADRKGGFDEVRGLDAAAVNRDAPLRGDVEHLV